MDINEQIKTWAEITESQINEVSDIDVDQETWADDMGRSDQRFYDEFLKGTNERYKNIIEQLEKTSEGSKISIIMWFMSVLEKSFDTQAEFDKNIQYITNSRISKFKMPKLYKDIVDTISHSIGENHYQKVDKEIKSELD